jgi:hypothetical protein
MQRGVVVLALGLLLLGAFAPGVEALSGCPQACDGDDGDNRCAHEVCCSCCLHAGPATVGPPMMQAPVPHSAPTYLSSAVVPPSADPRALLHVPKTAVL